MSRTPEIVADAAAIILSKPAGAYSGQTLIDEDVLLAEGVNDLSSYSVEPGAELFRDLFVD